VGKGSIAWDDAPEFGPKKYVRVLSPKLKKDLRLLICNRRLVGVWTHYMEAVGPGHKGKTQPCTGHRVMCAGCLRKRARRWKGYLGCWAPKVGEYCIAEVTLEAARSCHDLINPDVDLRGRLVYLQRMGDSANGPVMAKLLPYEAETYLPDELDVVGALTRLWGYESDAWSGDDRKPAV